MRRAPSVHEYERMSAAARTQAAAFVHDQEALIRARRARLSRIHADLGRLDATETLRAAQEMLPDVIAAFGDTPTVTALRRAAMQTNHRGAESWHREARAA